MNNHITWYNNNEVQLKVLSFKVGFSHSRLDCLKLLTDWFRSQNTSLSSCSAHVLTYLPQPLMFSIRILQRSSQVCYTGVISSTFCGAALRTTGGVLTIRFISAWHDNFQLATFSGGSKPATSHNSSLFLLMPKPIPTISHLLQWIVEDQRQHRQKHRGGWAVSIPGVDAIGP